MMSAELLGEGNTREISRFLTESFREERRKGRQESAKEIASLYDTIDRIRIAYKAIGLGCDCDKKGLGAACDVCEITYLLDEHKDEER